MVSIARTALAMGRRLASGLMNATVLIQRAGEPVRNPNTGHMEPALTTVYEGPARVRFLSADPRATDQAGQRFAEQTPTVWLPIDSTAGVRVDDTGTVTSNPDDPGTAGLQFRVAGVHAQTHSTSRRLPVEVLSFA